MPGNMYHKKLTELLQGENAVLVDFYSGRAVANRLASIGFTPGASISMANNYGKGPLIVSVRGTRVAIGRGEASKIIVEVNRHAG